MTQNRGFKKALSLVCTLCLMLSMLGSGPFAAIAEELGEDSAAADEHILPPDTAEDIEDEAGARDDLIDAPKLEADDDGPAPSEAVVEDEAPAEAPAAMDEPAVQPEPVAFSAAAAPSEEDAVPAGQERGARAATSTDLSQFLADVAIDAPTDENGNYVISPSSTYKMTLSFSENEGLQFADDETLVYDFPNGVVVGDLGPTVFSIDVRDENGTVTIHNNTYEVVDGRLRVHFDQNDPNYERLKATANVEFDITIASSYEQGSGQIEFAPGIVKEFTVDNSADVNITKSVSYDADANTASYVLQVSSAGLNENVVIEDHLTGTALIFNGDVSIESNLNGPISAAPDYSAVENGFRVGLPRLENGEVLTIRYTASVDYTKVTGKGSVEQTNNTARVTSDQVPDGKEASADFHGKVTYERIKKTAAGEPVQIGENLYEQYWTITVNAEHKMQVGGTEISDWIATNSRPFMQFTGDGITVKVTFENGSTETRTLGWDELTRYIGDHGRFGWGYLTPESDGKASYEITCTTLIDATNALNDLSLVNGAQIHSTYVEGTTGIDVVGESLAIEKEALGTTSTETDWAITVTVPGTGLPDFRVVDDAPKLTHEGQTYIDEFIEDSFEVEGLMENESWRLSVGGDGRTYTITFYRSNEQTDANKGVLPTADGQPRDIVIRFKTEVDQDWLDLAAEDGYTSGALIWHTNVANARSGDFRTPNASDAAFPVKPDLEKSFAERTDVVIDGVTYPVFRYTLRMAGPVEDGIVIHDAFNTEYLKFYEAGGVQITGGTTSMFDSNGSASAADTADGIDITVGSFPKNTDPALYPHEFYPFYEIEYSLIVKDQAALEALNADAAASTTGIALRNVATWGGLSSDEEVVYSYFPYVDKELLSSPTADNGYVAEFKIIINQYAEDLDPASDVLAIRDILSDNLRFLPDSLTVSPAGYEIDVQHDADTNTLTFLNIPDGIRFEVTYQARVLGQGSITYSNTVQYGTYEKTIEETTTVESSGGGTASNPSITLVKRDAESLSTTLSGASFDLYYMQGDAMVPVTDRNGRQVSFTTGADGKVLIVGNQTTLGWTLWSGRTYYLVETVAPAGYELSTEPIPFVLKEFPAGQLEYSITGDSLNVQNEREKTSVSVEKRWIGPAVAPVTVRLLANGVVLDEAELNSGNGWRHTFDNLPEYDAAGNVIDYSVTEQEGNGYTLISIDGDAERGFTITNYNTETVEVPVKKTWDDAGDQDGLRPDNVIVKLLANGAATGKTVELSEDNGWAGSFIELPKYADTGDEIVYTVEESGVPTGYAAEVTGSAAEGFTVTNAHTPSTTRVSVAKAWVDGDDADGKRPASVTIRLLANGEDAGRTVELSEANGWVATFDGLPEFEGGRKIAYTVEEVPVEGYASKVAGDAASGFVVTNTRETTPPPPSTSAVPKAGDAASAAGAWAAALLGGAAVSLLLWRRTRGEL